MKQLAQALVSAQAEMPAVDETGKSNFGAHMTLDHLIAITRPVLNKNGLAIVQLPAVGELGQPVLRTTISHVSGESLSADAPLFLPKQDMQALGAAITYARRYAWASACGVTSEKDDDGDSIRVASGSSAAETKKTGSARSTASRADSRGGGVAAAAPAPPTAEDLAALFRLVEERGGDVQRTSAGYDTAVKEGKVEGWYAKALAHWSAQPVASEFEKKAADAKAAGEKAQQARARQAAADRGEAA